MSLVTEDGFGRMPDRLFLGLHAGLQPQHWFGVWTGAYKQLKAGDELTVYTAVAYCQGLASRSDGRMGPHPIPIKHVAKAVWMSAGNPRMHARAIRRHLESLQGRGLVEILPPEAGEPGAVLLAHCCRSVSAPADRERPELDPT